MYLPFGSSSLHRYPLLDTLELFRSPTTRPNASTALTTVMPPVRRRPTRSFRTTRNAKNGRVSNSTGPDSSAKTTPSTTPKHPTAPKENTGRYRPVTSAAADPGTSVKSPPAPTANKLHATTPKISSTKPSKNPPASHAKPPSAEIAKPSPAPTGKPSSAKLPKPATPAPLTIEESTESVCIEVAPRGDDEVHSPEPSDDSSSSMQPSRPNSGAGEVQDEEYSSKRSAHSEGRKKKVYESSIRQRRRSGESNLVKKRKAAVEELCDVELAKRKCCTKKCCFANTDVVFLRNEAQKVLVMSKSQRRTYLEGLLETNSNLFFFSGKPVCYSFLEGSFGFSRDMQGNVKKIGVNQNPITSNSLDRDRTAQGRDSVICFLEKLAESTADVMPDKDEQHLPYFQKSIVYDIFCEEYKKLHGDKSPPTRSYFLHTWATQCGSIKVRKVHRFTKCTECESVREALAKAGTDQYMAAGLRERRRFHLDMVAAERREYQKTCERAMLYPSRVTSIIIDGADQSGFGLPHFTVNTKATVGRALKVKLVGVLEHGIVQHLSLFTMTTEFETGANHVIEALHRTLMAKASTKNLQGVLCVQLDNCTRENKNTFMFAYLESLVAWGVFTEVSASFLPIGHTHADIDQTFSCTARRLRNNNAITMEELMTELHKSYTPPPSVARMLNVINFSGLCVQERCIGKVEKFSQFRYFRFHRADGDPLPGASYKTACSVRVGCRDDWNPLKTSTEGCHGFLVRVCNLARTPPTPAVSPPDLKDIEDRFRSEETRINNHNKMLELYALRDNVYRDREVPFHWNLKDVFEHNGSYRSNHVPRDAGSDFNSDENADQTIMEDPPRSDLIYTINNFVAINGEDCTDDMPFWLGQIIEVHKNNDGVTSHITVRWFQVYDNKGPWTGKYIGSTIGKMKRPWFGRVSVDTVLAEFPALTKKRLTSAAEKEIIAGLSAVGRSLVRR